MHPLNGLHSVIVVCPSTSDYRSGRVDQLSARAWSKSQVSCISVR